MAALPRRRAAVRPRASGCSPRRSRRSPSCPSSTRHLALNDVPTLAPLTLSLLGSAGVLRQGGARDYAARRASGWGSPARPSTRPGSSLAAAAGARSRRAASTAAPSARERALLGARARGRSRALAASCSPTPTRVLDYSSFHAELVHQSSLSAEAQGKLGAPRQRRAPLLPVDAHLGPRLGARAGGARRALSTLWRDEPRARLAARPRAAAVPRLHGPAGPLLRPLADADPADPVPAGGVLRAAARRDARASARAPPRRLGGARAGCARGARRALRGRRAARAGARLQRALGARALARRHAQPDARAGWSRTCRAARGSSSSRSSPDAWARDDPGAVAAGANGYRWMQVRLAAARASRPTDRSRRRRRARSGIEDYERDARARADRPTTSAHGYCWVHQRLDPVRARASPTRGGPARDRLLPRAGRARRGRLPRLALRARAARRSPFNFDWSFDYYPLAYARPGPAMTVYRLRGGRCARLARRRGRARRAQGYPGCEMASCTDTDRRPPGARDRARAQRRRPRSSPTPSSARSSRATGRSSARAGTHEYGGAHAEVNAIEACGLADLAGATLYVSLEPCCHEGKTPPCTDAIVQAGHQARRGRLRRPDREGLRPRPGDPARRGRRGRARRRRAGRAARGCSTRRFASTRASGARGCCSSRR